MGSTILNRIPIVLNALAAALIFISGAMPYWMSTYNGTYTVTTGLWKTCTVTPEFNTCVAVDYTGSDEVKLDVVRAFLIIAFVSVLLAVITGVLLVFDSTQGFLAVVVMVFDLIAVISLAISVGVYANLHVQVETITENDLHASFGLAAVALVISLLAGILSCCCAREKSSTIV